MNDWVILKGHDRHVARLVHMPTGTAVLDMMYSGLAARVCVVFAPAPTQVDKIVRQGVSKAFGDRWCVTDAVAQADEIRLERGREVALMYMGALAAELNEQEVTL